MSKEEIFQRKTKRKETMNKLLTLDNLWKIGTTLMLVLGLYLNSNYVSNVRYDKGQVENTFQHNRITEILANINVSISLLQANSKTIEDVRVRQQQVIVDVADLRARVLVLELRNK